MNTDLKNYTLLKEHLLNISSYQNETFNFVSRHKCYSLNLNDTLKEVLIGLFEELIDMEDKDKEVNKTLPMAYENVLESNYITICDSILKDLNDNYEDIYDANGENSESLSLRFIIPDVTNIGFGFNNKIYYFVLNADLYELCCFKFQEYKTLLTK